MRQCTRKTSHARGFTLLEIAVVVLIIGFIVGALTIGRGLIRNAELQAIGAEYARYTTAIKAFEEKYYSLPGDFATATSVWGAAHATASTCITTASTTKLTCNGDGNGRITTQIAAYGTTFYEQFRAWQHLANANLISGTFSGVSTSGTYRYTVGTNIPESDFSGAGWRLITYTVADQVSGVAGLPALTVGDTPHHLVLWFGGSYTADSNLMGNIISPRDAQDIDLKIDDGKPRTGKLLAQNNTGSPSSHCWQDNEYRNSGSDFCALVFKVGH